MTITQRFTLLWRRFSPLEERLISAVRDVLPAQAQTVFDAQVAAITLVQRHPNEICFYRRLAGKVDWSGVPSFPNNGEFRLAEARFSAKRRSYKAALTCINGHVFDFTILPSPKAIAFTDWDSAATARLLSDPLTVKSANQPESIPDSWREFLARARPTAAAEWTFHDSQSAYRTAFNDGEFLVLAERAGDQFILHRIEPPASTLFYLDSHDGTPEPIKGDILDVFRKLDSPDA
jgi:hypothetical protein